MRLGIQARKVTESQNREIGNQEYHQNLFGPRIVIMTFPLSRPSILGIFYNPTLY